MKKLLLLLLIVLLLCSCSKKLQKPLLASGKPEFNITQKDGTQMPSFVYVGDNLAIATICDWFYEDAERHASYGDVGFLPLLF